MRKGLENMTKHWINTLLFETDYRFWSFEDIANWFRQNYDYTPVYTLDLVSPLAKRARTGSLPRRVLCGPRYKPP